jgi:putative DNA primase/helicase
MYYGVDLDNCVRKDGSFTDFAEEVVFGLNSYTEVSPSGRGLKIFCKINPGEKLPETFKGRNGWPIEVYSHSRFFTCTGKHIIDTPLTVNASSYTEHFIALANAERPDGTPVQQDREFDVIYDADEDVVDVVLAIINSRVATKFLRFQEGDTTGYPSASEADFALMGLLSFFTNNNIPLMLKIAETTGLKRPKWRTRRNGVNYLHYIAKIVVGRTTGRPTT